MESSNRFLLFVIGEVLNSVVGSPASTWQDTFSWTGFDTYLDKHGYHEVVTWPFELPEASLDDKEGYGATVMDGFQHRTETVLQSVEHPAEEIARRDDALLHEQAAQDWADNVERIVRHGGSNDDPTPENEATWLFPYQRTPAEFVEALLRGPELQHVRDDLEDHSHEVTYKGAKIFVRPHQYMNVVEALTENRVELKTSHVVISETFLPSLEASIASIPSRKNVRVKAGGASVLVNASTSSSSTDQQANEAQSDQGNFVVMQSEGLSDEWKHVLSTERTFLCDAKTLRNSQSVTQSTTEAHQSLNPRRVIATPL